MAPPKAVAGYVRIATAAATSLAAWAVWKAYAELALPPAKEDTSPSKILAEVEKVKETKEEEPSPVVAEEDKDEEEASIETPEPAVPSEPESPEATLKRMHAGLPGFFAPTSAALASQASSTTASTTYCTGLAAAGTAAYAQSDLVFVYNTGDAGNLEKDLRKLVEMGEVNTHGRVPMIEVIETRTGAGTIAAGANAVEARVSVIVSSQSLPLMLQYEMTNNKHE